MSFLLPNQQDDRVPNWKQHSATMLSWQASNSIVAVHFRGRMQFLSPNQLCQSTEGTIVVRTKWPSGTVCWENKSLNRWQSKGCATLTVSFDSHSPATHSHLWLAVTCDSQYLWLTVVCDSQSPVTRSTRQSVTRSHLWLAVLAVCDLQSVTRSHLRLAVTVY